MSGNFDRKICVVSAVDGGEEENLGEMLGCWVSQDGATEIMVVKRG